MPITWPLTFSSPPVDWYRANDDTRGERVKEEREKEDAVRGSYRLMSMYLVANLSKEHYRSCEPRRKHLQ